MKRKRTDFINSGIKVIPFFPVLADHVEDTCFGD